MQDQVGTYTHKKYYFVEKIHIIQQSDSVVMSLSERRTARRFVPRARVCSTFTIQSAGTAVNHTFFVFLYGVHLYFCGGSVCMIDWRNHFSQNHRPPPFVRKRTLHTYSVSDIYFCVRASISYLAVSGFFGWNFQLSFLQIIFLELCTTTTPGYI